MLKLNEVTLKFGGLVANDKVSLEVEDNQIFGLIGPNGAGKTTLFNVISGVYTPTSGEVVFKGEKINGIPPYKINAKGIARTYQNINLFKKMTVLENVMVGCHSRSKAGLAASVFRVPSQRKEEQAIRDKSMEIMEFMGIADLAMAKAGSLPYGKQRRLEICRALASEPSLLLLDEPAAGMNSSEKVELSEDIKKIQSRGYTVLLVEHDMKLVVNICEKLCVLNNGKRISYGDPDMVMNDPVVIEAYLGGDLIE